MGDFDHFNSTPPADLGKPAGDNSPATPPAVAPAPETAPVSGTPPAEPAKAPETIPDAFIEGFNKRYNTTYKSDDEVKSLFTLPEKVKEYETKLSDRDELAKSVDKYKNDLEELRVNGTSELLSKPLIRRAYVAEQLQAKYPDRDAFVLQEIAMSDIDKMSDVEAIAKEKMVSIKGLTFEDAKLAKLADFGIDANSSPAEWDDVQKARVRIAGAESKERIKQLLQGIELPKQPMSKEEQEKVAAKALEDKVRVTQPVREAFKKFDRYVNGDFEFVVSDEFKAKLDDVFQGMFIDSGLDVNEKTLKTAEMFKRAMFVEEYFPKMKEVIVKQAQTALREQLDKELHNDAPLNSATATDQTPQPDRKGVSSFFHGDENKRTTKL